MSSWIDKKYITLSSGSLRNFRWKSTNLANCSCPLCGDSSSNKLKARLYFYERNNSYSIYCHNCSASMSFRNFLKTYSPSLYDEYTKDLYLETPQDKSRPISNTIEMPTPKFLGQDSILKDIKKISQLKFNHPARIYVDNRKIPTYIHYKLYYTPKFKEWVNSILPDKFKHEGKDEPRLVIPFFDKKKNVFAFQGRAFTDIEPKYYSITLDDSYPKIYGLDTVNFNKTYYITEGPIDSIFINNGIAMGGSDFRIDPNLLPNIFEKAVVIYDNEPRNKQITAKMENTLKKGVKIVIWPDTMKLKDINDMVKDGMTKDILNHIIKENTYSGLEGLARLNFWRKS